MLHFHDDVCSVLKLPFKYVINLRFSHISISLSTVFLDLIERFSSLIYIPFSVIIAENGKKNEFGASIKAALQTIFRVMNQ